MAEWLGKVYKWLLCVGSKGRSRSDTDVFFVNYMSLRKAVGLLGSLLPFILLAVNPIAVKIVNSGCGLVPDSVSGFYYTPARNIFVGGLCALGLFLIAYVGYDCGDRLVTDAAGVFAVGVALFPTAPSTESPPSVACQTVAAVSTRETFVGDVHFVSAALMFVFLAWMAIRFTNTNKPSYSQKLLRNRIYRICAIVILACLVAAFITNFLPDSVKAHFPWWLFLYEALAILAFGVSWFVKGQTLIGAIKDVPEEVPEPVA